ncbi:proline dehydrogenase family protein [Maridesulfovibrio sp.]|uniref:proline dehydrogenase family protein n=1 Tax=Maridesulfovibrio sp. TaxID=2795000 RepID=UPI002AA95D54|nr:proline dehydrogenase family protein [Maridesulfovibrio sp.]
MKRFFFRTIALVCCIQFLIGSEAPLLWAGQPERTDSSPSKFFLHAETITVQKLDTIEKQLQAYLDSDESSLSDRLRNNLIDLSMWGPMAGCSQWFLETLGDSGTARNIFFFAMPLVKWMSEPFIFPVETEGADSRKEVNTVFNLISRLKKDGMESSLDNVGDASLSPQDARDYRNYYLKLIEQFVRDKNIPELAVSLKFSALVHNQESAVDMADPQKAAAKRKEIKSALVALLEAAKQSPKKLFLRIDMEEYVFKDMTLEIFREVVEENPSLIRNHDGSLRLGVVIQAYLRDSAKDVVALAKWAQMKGFRVPIRLVKGAYLVHEREEAQEEGRKSPVWNFKPSTDANYEGLCTYMLLNRDVIQPAFATHNIRSIAHVMGLAETLGISSKDIELQMLYGMGDPIKKAIVAMGYSMREYIPAGSLARGLKYAGRRFQELANSDNALARTMRGDFTSVDGTAPEFKGEEDIKDGEFIRQVVQEALVQLSKYIQKT